MLGDAILNYETARPRREILENYPQVLSRIYDPGLLCLFSAGVDWCCSEQFDADVAKAALAIGLAPEEATTGAVRKTG